jgi:GMP reductase
MKDFYLSYRNVWLRPKHSSLPHRSDADTSIEFLGKRFFLPVIPANMSDVISPELAKKVSESGYFYIMHRFNDMTSKFVKYAAENKLPYTSISVGNSTYEKDLQGCEQYSPDFITIDVAHGDHDLMEKAVRWIKFNYPGAKIIAGNVATANGYEYLYKLGVDAVKVGIGGGSICTTKNETGFHVPTLSSIIEIKRYMDYTGNRIPIIADGGIRENGDIAKALAFGADMVMCGSLFASCIDSPAEFTDDGQKIYRGSTSYESKGVHKHIEGKTLSISKGCTYLERFERIKQSLQSSISYGGGKDLLCLRYCDYGVEL